MRTFGVVKKACSRGVSGKRLQVPFGTGNSPRKRADGARKIAADLNTLPDHINNHCFLMQNMP